MNYIKKYAQGFVVGIMLSVLESMRRFDWNNQGWKHWLIYILILPVIIYVLSDLNKDFIKVRFFSKESIFMTAFALLGIISCIFMEITLGLFES